MRADVEDAMSRIEAVLDDVIETLAARQKSHHGGSTSKKEKATASETRRGATIAAVDALKELHATHVSLAVLDGTNVRERVMATRDACDDDDETGTVRKLCESLIAQWRGALRSHVGTLAARYERPPPPPAPFFGGGGGGVGKTGKPRPVYDAAYVAARRNEPELRATRGKSGFAKAAADAAAGGLDAGGGAAASAPASAPKPPKPPPKATKKSSSTTNAAAGASLPHNPGPGGAPPKPKPKSHKKGAGATFHAHNPGTPLGKGRKLCQECHGVVGSPTRICPHCNASLPFKQSGASPKAKAAAAAGAAIAAAQGGGGGGGGSGSEGGPPVAVVAAAAAEEILATSAAAFLSRHQSRLASCKVSQLRRTVAEVCAGVNAVLDAGRLTDPIAAKHLRELTKKISDVKMLQGVVEKPKARNQVAAAIEAAVKTCQRQGV